MGAAIAGKKGNVYACTHPASGSGTPVQIAGIDAWSMDITVPIAKLKTFAVDGYTTLAKDTEWSGSFSGFWWTGADGAKAAMDLLVAGALVDIELCVDDDDTAPIKIAGTVRLGSGGAGQNADGDAATVNFSFEGDGLPTITYEAAV
jgi:hypothetical protein